MFIVLVIFTIIIGALLFVSIRRNLQYSEKLEELGDQIDESLDIIDKCYKRISTTAETPVLSDEPIVQQLISDIKLTRDAILLVANKIVIFDSTDENENDDNQS
jgi:CHASE3 domain sensor protein